MTTYEMSGPEAVDPGTYRAKCISVEEIDSEYGRRIKWKFTLPEADGHEVSRFTSTAFSEKSKATETTNALFGRKLERGEVFEVGDLIGKSCVLILDVAESGWNRVEKALPISRKPAARPAVARAPQPDYADDYGDTEELA